MSGWHIRDKHGRDFGFYGLNKALFVRRTHKLKKQQVQETQKQYAYLSATHKWEHSNIYDGKMANYS